MKNIRTFVFWPAFLLLLSSLLLNFANKDMFVQLVTGANNWLIANFGWGFSWAAFLALITVIIAYVSPLGNVKLGGPDAKPMLDKKNWFAITLCTTLAAGILFWGTAEPIYHISSPPQSLGYEPFSPEAIKFAMETMYLHWTFVPYALYTILTLTFAFAYFNMKKSFSIGSQIAPLLGNKENNGLNTVIDAICLWGIGAGMAASFGTSIMNMGGAINSITGIPSGPTTWLVLAALGVTVFVISASSGLMKGIKLLSDINMKVYYVIIAIVFIFGPTAYMLNLGTEAFGGFLTHLFEKSLFTGAAAGDQWPQWWTTFYWANWIAWAPVSAVFLARISYGYTVRDLIQMNLILPGIFSAVWMTIFSGTSIYMHTHGVVDLVQVLNTVGPEGIAYAILRQFPLAGLIIPFFLFIVFITFVTAADSTTNAMAALSSTGITPENPEASTVLKAIWGISVGALAWIMISILGINGIKMLSNLGGFIGTFLVFGAVISLFILISKHEKLNVYSNRTNNSNTKEAPAVISQGNNLNM
ncbi:BCCT family transporter [Zhaonella formicivorans]|uniref:BCCT family transporter n=1 Tax=Zhaonella formicivorans TaxID=2528593 RepID=UPI0010DD2545|nr:BCCT family transporter [Zhaonella formicivorans]